MIASNQVSRKLPRYFRLPSDVKVLDVRKGESRATIVHNLATLDR
ncbi:MAG: hypothetical protein AAF514_07805 [Verrucomicrobiota bacterium]